MTSNSGQALADLAQEINEHDEARRACEAKGVMHACRIGQLLIEAKRITPHGGFLDWLKANTAVTPRMCQMYMAIARDRDITEQFEREYETVSHLTITKAVKLARERKSLEQLAASINKLSASLRGHQQRMAEALAEMQRHFETDETFNHWMVKAIGFSSAFAEKIPELLAKEYDDEAWLDAMLANFEAEEAHP
jgi:hypothetical protein